MDMDATQTELDIDDAKAIVEKLNGKWDDFEYRVKIIDENTAIIEVYGPAGNLIGVL